jgi:putative aldouronate transport system permease protein
VSASSAAKSAAPLVRHVSWQTRLKRDRSLLLMVSPTIVLLVVFCYVPMLGNIIAWQDYSPYTGFVHSPFVGWGAFVRVFNNAAFAHAVVNTLTITTFQLVFFFPVPIALALLLNSLITPRLRTLVQSVVYLPHFFSWVLVVTLFQQIFGGAGLISQTIRQHGGSGFDLMTNPDTFILLLTGQSVWKEAGWGIIIFLAAIATVSPELYEAAAMDGAGKWRRMWHITLPAIRPVVILLLILQLGSMLSVGFEQIILQRAAVGPGVSEVIDTYVYFQGVVNGDWSFATAAGLMKGVISLVLVLGANQLAHMLGESGIYRKA